MVERSRLKVSREVDAVVGRVRVTAKNHLKLLETLLNIPEIQAQMPKGGAAIRQFDAWDREAKEIAALPVDKRRKRDGRLRFIINELHGCVTATVCRYPLPGIGLLAASLPGTPEGLRTHGRKIG